MTNVDGNYSSDLIYYMKLNLRNHILEKDINIKIIADKINRSIPSMYRYLNTSNDDLPNLEILEKLVNCLDMSLDEFVSETVAMSESGKINETTNNR